MRSKFISSLLLQYILSFLLACFCTLFWMRTTCFCNCCC